MPELALLKNKLLKYRDADIFANNIDWNIKYPTLAKSVTPGQACVFYDHDKCLGCGFIKDVYKDSKKLWYLS